LDEPEIKETKPTPTLFGGESKPTELSSFSMLNSTSPSVTPSLARATSTITPKIDLAQKKPDDPKPDDK